MSFRSTLCRAAAVGWTLALVGVLLAEPALAQNPPVLRRLPSSQTEVQLSYAPVVRKVAPAVVNVYAAKVVENRNPFMEDPFFRRFFGGENNGLRREQVQRSLGSGVIVDPSGLIVTNYHVIAGADAIKVALADKREFEADVVLRDQRSDLAVLKLKGVHETFPTVELGNSDDLQVGDIVLAIGDPFGVGQTVTHGIVSAVARTQIGISDYRFFIQTDAAINPGNSGGALVDLNGKLVGINSAIYSRTGGSQGIGFAIPVNMVRVVVASAKTGVKTVMRPWLGAKLQEVTRDVADGLGLKRPIGALVASVARGSPAAQAGLRPGDVVLAIDGQNVDDANALNFRFATKPIGGKTEFTVMRAGKEIKVAVPLVAAPAINPSDFVRLTSRSPLEGATVSDLSPTLAEEMRLEPGVEGVVVVSVGRDTRAADLGLRRGDVVVAINGRRVTNAHELETLLRQPQDLWRVQVKRGRQILTAETEG